MSMNIEYHWDSDVPVELVSRPWFVDGRWLFSEELQAYADEPVEWNVTIEDVLSYPRVWLVSQDAFGPAGLTSHFLDLLPPTHSERLGPFVVYLFVP
jgi:hypothetical protein